MRTFVTVHDAGLLPECDRRFHGLDVTYLFVGPRTPPDRGDVIHCAAHTPNVEHLRLFYDFTGWFVLADLIRSGQVTDERLLLMQYDMKLQRAPRFVLNVSRRLLAQGLGPVSFERGDASDWLSAADPTFAALFAEALATKGIDLAEIPFDPWPAQQGMAWRSSDFVEFVDWFTPLFDVLAPHLLAGHIAERTIHAWCHSTGRPATIARGMIWHDRYDSHGTTALFYGDNVGYEAKAATFAC